MKRFIISMMAAAPLLLAGCSAGLESSASDAETFAAVAEELGDTFMDTRDTLKPLQDKQLLTSEDQKQLVEKIDALIQEMHKFKEEEAPLIARAPKKTVVKELDKKEEILSAIQEKAKLEKADQEDVKKVIKTLSSDIEIELFKK